MPESDEFASGQAIPTAFSITMTDFDPDNWLHTGKGRPPRERWSFTAEAPLTGMKLSRESGQIVAADESGGVYRLDRHGRIAAVTRGFFGVRLVACDDLGDRAAVVDHESRLSLFDEKLRVVWSLGMPEGITAIDVESHGRYVAVALANGKTVVYDAHHRRMFQFTTQRRLSVVRFLDFRPALVVAAEYGLLGKYDFQGRCLWSSKLPMNIGDLTCTGEGDRVSVAAFSQGIRHINGAGQPDGSYLLEGTPNRLSASITPFRLAVTTLEGHLYWLDETGDIVWAAALPEEAVSVETDALGSGLACGFHSGRIVCFGWN